MKILSLILYFLIVSCSPQSDKLVIGTCADNPPYEYIKNSQVVGIDIDIIKEIAKILNKEIEIKNLEFSMLMPSLVTGNVDIVIAGISPTDERRKNVDFSEIYMNSQVSIIFKDSLNINSSTDLHSKALGAQFATTWSMIAKKLSNKVRELSSNLLLLEELIMGKIDILVLEESQAKIFTSKYPNLKYMNIDESSDFVIALPKNSLLTSEINNAINKLKTNQTIERIQNEWFKKN